MRKKTTGAPPSPMTTMSDLIDDCASEVLDHLSQILPDVDDNGELAEAVLERALETYREVLLVMLKNDL